MVDPNRLHKTSMADLKLAGSNTAMVMLPSSKPSQWHHSSQLTKASMNLELSGHVEAMIDSGNLPKPSLVKANVAGDIDAMIHLSQLSELLMLEAILSDYGEAMIDLSRLSKPSILELNFAGYSLVMVVYAVEEY